MDYKRKILNEEAKRLIGLGSSEPLTKIAHIHKNNPLNIRILDKLGNYVYRKLATNGSESSFPYATEELVALLKAGDVKRNRIILLGDYLAVKYPDLEDTRDENVHEASVGLQVNKIRKVLPNFVWTYGIIKCPPIASTKGYNANRKYKCCITEKVNGVSFSLWARRKSFYERFLIYVQIWLALAYANREIGFTHNDLHMGNALIIHLNEETTIEYEQTTIKTKDLVKIIDFGRSFAYGSDGTVLGRIIAGQSIRLAPNYWYDAYFILQRSIREDEKKDPEVKKFIDFFGIHQTGRLYDDMRQIVQKTYNFDKWLDLIFNCPSGKALLRRRHVQTQRVEAPPLAPNPARERITLPADFHFDVLRKYLEVHDFRDMNLVRRQIIVNEARVNKLTTIRDNLKNRIALPSDLKILNPDDYPESKQEIIVSSLGEIANISNSLHLKRHLDFAIEKYRQRLDFLFKWLTR